MSACWEYLDQALTVEPIVEDFDPEIPPVTGQEYIQRVVLEASQCKDVIVANERPLVKKQTVVIGVDFTSVEDPVVKPSPEWQRCQVADFAELRQKLSKMKATYGKPSYPLPQASDEAGWYSLCFGDNVEPLEREVSKGGSPPLLTIMLSMNQQLIEQVLEYHVEWLETKTSLSTQQGQWLYALLACMELPLIPETCSLIRSLARECSRIRASLKSVDEPSIVPLTLLICLVANYFRQIDLADN